MTIISILIEIFVKLSKIMTLSKDDTNILYFCCYQKINQAMIRKEAIKIFEEQKVLIGVNTGISLTQKTASY